MLLRLFAVLVCASIAVGCGGAGEEKKREGTKASAVTPPETTEDGKNIHAKLEGVSKTARTSLEKEKIPETPLKTEYYILSDAYEATGFRIEALRKKVGEKETKNSSYVKLVTFNGLPEVADIYDDLGNHLNIVSYLWDDKFNVHGAVHKSANDRMLGMYLYCKGEKDMFVHKLSTFRVHAPFAMKIIENENSLVVELVDGHNLKGELPAWPECEDVTEAQEKAGPFQSPFGVHREVYSFDESGNLLSSASYDLKGGLVEDIKGIAKREVQWTDGLKTGEAFYSADELLARLVFTYDEKGLMKSRSSVDANGKAAVDYFGYASYEYEHGKRDRVVRETRKDIAGKPVEIHEYTHAKFSQVESHKVLDGQGNLETTYFHTFNKKGARTEFAVYDGDAAARKLKLDANGVALYRFKYTDKGRLLKESRHGTAQVVDEKGNQDFVLANAMDGWALIENTYNKEDERVIDTTVMTRVDGNGNRLFIETLNGDGVLLHRLEKTFQGNVALTGVKTLFEKTLPIKKLFLDGSEKVLQVALLQHNADGLLMEVVYFNEDEKTPALATDGYHKLVRTYTEDQKPETIAYFDLAGVKVKTTRYEYSEEDGTLKATRHYDAEGKEIPAA
jgi:hypothetical protein